MHPLRLRVSAFSNPFGCFAALGLNWLATVRHGLPVGEIAWQSSPRGGYLAFLGRMSPEKRPDFAIEVAKSVGLPLRIAAKVDEADHPYFDREIRGLLNHPLVEFVGELDDRQKWAFLGDALCPTGRSASWGRSSSSSPRP